MVAEALNREMCDAGLFSPEDMVRQRQAEKKEYHVLSLGAGVQSTTLYLMFMHGEITPQINCAIFADTQDEPASVYRHLEWLESLGGPPILRRTNGCLSADLLREDTRDGRFATIPAFAQNGGKVQRQCSRDYKTNVIERTIRREIVGLAARERMPDGVVVHQYIGISLDEAGRARRISDRFRRKLSDEDIAEWREAEFRWGVPHFPLLDRFMTRGNCHRYLASKVPHEVPKSACRFCPFHDDRAWAKMRDEEPDEWRQAVEFDRAIREPGRMIGRGLSEALYLHRSCKPLDLVQLDDRPRPQQQSIGFWEECEGMCGV